MSPIEPHGFPGSARRHRSLSVEGSHTFCVGASGTEPITLQHLGARWYDPALGRFIQRDPIGIIGDLNVYECSDSEPVSTIDPSGLSAQGPGFFDPDGPLFRKGNPKATPPVRPGSLNHGPLRVGQGWKGTKDAGRMVFRMGIGNWHLDGALRAGLGFGGACVVAVGVGVGAAYLLNKGTKLATGRSLVERLGDWIAPPITNIPGWYNPGPGFGRPGALGW